MLTKFLIAFIVLLIGANFFLPSLFLTKEELGGLELENQMFIMIFRFFLMICTLLLMIILTKSIANNKAKRNKQSIQQPEKSPGNPGSGGDF